MHSREMVSDDGDAKVLHCHCFRYFNFPTRFQTTNFSPRVGIFLYQNQKPTGESKRPTQRL